MNNNFFINNKWKEWKTQKKNNKITFKNSNNIHTLLIFMDNNKFKPEIFNLINNIMINKNKMKNF
jgi:hypothetical protein